MNLLLYNSDSSWNNLDMDMKENGVEWLWVWNKGKEWWKNKMEKMLESWWDMDNMEE
jgi:hypothetical protein